MSADTSRVREALLKGEKGKGFCVKSATGHSVYSALYIPILGQHLMDLKQLYEENKKKTVTEEGERCVSSPHQPTPFQLHTFSSKGEVQSVP